MHLGNLRTALLAWLQARSVGGDFHLRFEDLDTGRVRPAAYDITRRDLAWLGLDWDSETRQSDRQHHYAHALSRLPTYPCTCTRREVLAAMQDAAGAPHGPEPVYPGTCLHGHDPARPAARRWHTPDARVCVPDHWTGEQVCQTLKTDAGDFVLRRNDGVYAYHLAVVVDDALTGVTDVLRGQDLQAAMPRQAALAGALGYAAPRYWQVPLLTDYRGERLAKRGGAPSVQALREGGQDPARLRAELLASLGWPVGESVGVPEALGAYRAQVVDRAATPDAVPTPPPPNL
ncbi:glutamyl-Q tRNA(Asp) synthetase [Deinococcus aquiradiocola]|uniref:Glutamyl-Q tRNA(Asp) synthetase n=2 Tax=Deinococcus aquiradiocola TaxID=393059 RepID=A0A917P6U6_9DEIO|nr:glutamyl-Q tRNA(Asp) synthetase [Deinococcus aquiradiocola]